MNNLSLFKAIELGSIVDNILNLAKILLKILRHKILHCTLYKY